MNFTACVRRGVLGLCGPVLLLSACTVAQSGPPAAVTTAAPVALDMGHSALEAGDHRAAGTAFEEALRRDPASSEAQLGLAEVRLADGRFAEAERAFGRLAEGGSDPASRAEALAGRGLALLALGRVPEARASLELATQAAPDSARAWNGLGQALDRDGNASEALRAYRRALILKPAWAVASNNLGLSLLAAGDARAAEEAFAKALAADPDLAVAEMNLRLAIAAQGRYDEAVAGAARERRVDVLNNVGYVALLRGDRGVASALLERALAASPSLHRPAQRNLDYVAGQDAHVVQVEAP